MTLRKKVMENWNRSGGPILVHCSAGVGRTGTFITIDLALEQAKTEGVVDIPGIVNRLREQRMQMVQTVVCTLVYWSLLQYTVFTTYPLSYIQQQYIFLYNAILEYVVCGLTEVPCENFSKELAKLKKINPTSGKSKLQYQFEVGIA